jgi:hypothetical protein
MYTKQNGLISMDTFFDDLHWAHIHGVWELLSFLILVAGAVVGLKLAFFHRRRIRNLNFYTRPVRDPSAQFPLIIYIEIRNYTGRTVVLSSPFIRFRDLRPSPDAHGDTLSGEYEIKFPDPSGQQLTEIEFLLRNKENVRTYMPLDPTLSDPEVQTALKKRRLGSMTVTCTWMSEKPLVEKLVRRL